MSMAERKTMTRAVKNPVKRKLTRAEKKEIAAVIQAAKGDGKPHTAQQTIPYLQKLLTNASKYTKEGGSVRIGQENGLLVLRDTGIGIRPEDLPRIFEWGYTGYNGRLDKRSTGVGLALVKQVMEMLGNKMEIRSVLGEGTEVFLDLRRTELEAE